MIGPHSSTVILSFAGDVCCPAPDATSIALVPLSVALTQGRVWGTSKDATAVRELARFGLPYWWGQILRLSPQDDKFESDADSKWQSAELSESAHER